MKLLFISTLLSVAYIEGQILNTTEENANQHQSILNETMAITGEEEIPITNQENENEDQRILNETIAKYGPPQDYKAFDLPGPQVAVDGEIFTEHNKLISEESGNYTLRIRTVTEHFSYNGRYEEGTLQKINNQEIPITKGQFGEHFERKNGGYYIRTIGYTVDESGYEQFLLDISIAKTTFQEEIIYTRTKSGHPGAPSSTKLRISSTVLPSLTGGNIG